MEGTHVRRAILIFIVAGMAAVCCRAANTDVPQWRGGPERTGAVTGPAVLASWPKDGPPLLWKAMLPESNSAGSVVVVGKVAYVTLAHYVPGDAAKGEKEHGVSSVYALDTLTGAVIWRHDVGDTIGGWLLPGGTPAVADGRVFVIYGPATINERQQPSRSKTIKVCCLDAAKGDLLWKAEQEATTVNITMHGGPYNSPLVVDGVCLVQETGIVAYSAVTGKVLWKQACADGAHAAPSAWRCGNRTLVLCPSIFPIDDMQKKVPAMAVVKANDKANLHFGGVYALDLKTGEPQWAACLQLGMWNASEPVVSGDTLLFLGMVNATAMHLDLRAPTILWTTPDGVIKMMGHYGPSPAVADCFAYFPDFTALHCISMADGTPAKSQKLELHQQSGVFTSASVVNDQVIFCDAVMGKSGTVYLLQAGKDMHVLSSFPVAGLLQYATPTISNGLLYLRLNDGVACYDLRAAKN